MTSPKVGPGAPAHILLQDWLRANDADEAHGDASIPVVVAALAPSVGSCVEINQCVGCTAAVLAPSSGEEPA